MKKSFLKVFGFGLVTLAFCFSTMFFSAPLNAAEPIKLGAIFSISGWAGPLGTGQKQACEVMVEQLNKNGGLLGRPIELFVEDDKSVPTNALIAATKLVKDKKVCALLGPTLTDCGMAIIPMAEKEQVPFLVLCPVISPFKKWIFLAGPGDYRIAVNLTRLAAQELGKKRIALFHDTANYGATAAKIIKEEIKKYPESKIIITEKADPSDTSMVSQLMKIKAAKPDLLITYTAGAPAVVIAKNYKQLGMTTQVLAPGAVPMPAFLQAVGNIAEESKWLFLGFPIIVAETLQPDDPYRKDLYEPFKKLLQAKYGPKLIPNIFHVGPYDGVNIMAKAIEKAGSDDPVAIRDALEQVKFDGFLGPYGATPTDHQGAQEDIEIMMHFTQGRMVAYGK